MSFMPCHDLSCYPCILVSTHTVREGPHTPVLVLSPTVGRRVAEQYMVDLKPIMLFEHL